MATLESTCELAWRQLFPNPNDETSIDREEFVETGRNEAAYQILLWAWKEKNETGEYNIPSYLLQEVELPIVDNKMDISNLKILRSLPQEIWVSNIGGINCQCKYVKSNVNQSQLLCDDDSMDDMVRTYYLLGKNIVFPQGVHKSPLTFIYANSGQQMNGLTEISDEIAAIVRTRLIEIYVGKIGKEDVTNNTSSET
jgi:hypothetical protein